MFFVILKESKLSPGILQSDSCNSFIRFAQGRHCFDFSSIVQGSAAIRIGHETVTADPNVSRCGTAISSGRWERDFANHFCPVVRDHALESSRLCMLRDRREALYDRR